MLQISKNVIHPFYIFYIYFFTVILTDVCIYTYGPTFSQLNQSIYIDPSKESVS